MQVESRPNIQLLITSYAAGCGVWGACQVTQHGSSYLTGHSSLYTKEHLPCCEQDIALIVLYYVLIKITCVWCESWVCSVYCLPWDYNTPCAFFKQVLTFVPVRVTGFLGEPLWWWSSLHHGGQCFIWAGDKSSFSFHFISREQT